MTLKKARLLLRTMGMTIRMRDREYRVNFKDGQEATAYYTNDLDDAVNTGQAMAQHMRGSRSTNG